MTDLTKTEAATLALLQSRAPGWLTVAELFAASHPNGFAVGRGGVGQSVVVRQIVARIRKKLDPDAVQNKRGGMYRWVGK